MKNGLKISAILLLLSILTVCMAGCSLLALNDKDFDIHSVECIEMDLSELSNEYSQNQLRAKETYLDKYVITSGEVTNISSDFIKISTSKYTSPSLRVHCEIKSTISRDILLSLNKGDTVLIKGKVTDMFGSFGLDVYIDTYYIEVTTQNNV